ncbi:MAG TPA: SgcJ/EcaC family oxidoreductase [Vicinamibacterales bacterium]|nr:SgcJ/EcaC family oxidoreductase [Vicinamibacterales bacterium]
MTRNIAAVGVLALVMMLQTSTAIRAQAPTDGELRRLGDAYAQAWAKGDARALAGLHTTEAILIAADAKVSVGRAAIEQAMKEALTGPYRGTKFGMTPGQTTRAGQDVYVAEGTYLITGGMPPAGYPTRGRYLNTLVRTNGRWFIASHADVAAQRPPK